MPVPFIQVGISQEDIRTKIINKVSRLIDANSFIGGEEVDLFSSEFSQFCGGGFCAPVANGTDALILALRALGVRPGDEVITVPFTFIATTEAISVVGATIRFVDINPKTYTMDVTHLEKMISPKTKCFLPVHLFGQPADMDPLLEIARRHKIKVIEDAAQAHGAEYKGKRVGVLGDAACFSFYPTKNLGAFGDAGAVVSGSEEVIKKVKQISDHGRIDRYRHAIEGVNSRLDAIQAAILRIKLNDLEENNGKRRSIATRYHQAISKSNYISPPIIESYAKHVFHLYCVESSYRDQLQDFLKARGIGCGIYYPIPLHLQPAYAHLGYKRGDFPVSERVSERILALPMFPEMSSQQVVEVCNALGEFLPK